MKINNIIIVSLGALLLINCGGKTEEENETKHEIIQNKEKVESQSEVVNPAIENLEKGKQFLDENSKKEGVVTLPSGLQYKVLKEGNGNSPSVEDEITVHYHGTHLDGSVFDSSVDAGEPITYTVNGFIKGWQEALPLMKEGGKWKVFIPSDLAYGEFGSVPVIGHNETLIFEIELISVNK